MRGRAVLFVFVATQVLDGALTYAGVRQGLAPEGNPLVEFLMRSMGLFSALCFVKLLAVFFGGLLFAFGRITILVYLTVFFWVIAILPWLVVLAGV